MHRWHRRCSRTERLQIWGMRAVLWGKLCNVCSVCILFTCWCGRPEKAMALQNGGAWFGTCSLSCSNFGTLFRYFQSRDLRFLEALFRGLNKTSQLMSCQWCITFVGLFSSGSHSQNFVNDDWNESMMIESSKSFNHWCRRYGYRTSMTIGAVSRERLHLLASENCLE